MGEGIFRGGKNNLGVREAFNGGESLVGEDLYKARESSIWGKSKRIVWQKKVGQIGRAS